MLEERQHITLEQQNKFFLQQNRVERLETKESLYLTSIIPNQFLSHPHLNLWMPRFGSWTLRGN
jgi:hypothetical protein